MTIPRIVPVFTPSGAYVADAGPALLSVMAAPEDITAAYHIRALLRSEAHIHDVSAAVNPQETAFAANALKPYRKAKKAAAVAGHVVLSLAALERHNMPVSLARAVFMTAEFLADAEAHKVANGYPLSERDIRARFYAFKNVAHLWAAQLIFPDAFLAAPESMFAMADFLGRARMFEDVMGRTLNAQTEWNPWRVPYFIEATDPLSLPQTKAEYLQAALRYTKSGGA